MWLSIWRRLWEAYGRILREEREERNVIKHNLQNCRKKEAVCGIWGDGSVNPTNPELDHYQG